MRSRQAPSSNNGFTTASAASAVAAAAGQTNPHSHQRTPFAIQELLGLGADGAANKNNGKPYHISEIQGGQGLKKVLVHKTLFGFKAPIF